MFSTEYIYHSIKYEKTVGIVNENEHEDFYEIIEPVGVIAGVTPVTNPTSTTMFKSIISAKTRNLLYLRFIPLPRSAASRPHEFSGMRQSRRAHLRIAFSG